MDGTGGDYVKRNKSNRERQLSYGFTHMWSIRNRAEDHRGRKGKLNRKKSERESLWNPRNKLRVTEGRGIGR